MVDRAIAQFQVGSTKYLAIPNAQPIRATYDQSRDRHIVWGSYVGTHGVLGPPYAIPAMTTLDVNDNPVMFSTGPWWIDGNHASAEQNFLSLAFYLFTAPVAGNDHLFNPELSFILLDDLKISGTLRGHQVDLKGGNFGFWAQCLCKKTNKYANYFFKQNLNDALTEEGSQFELNISLKNAEHWEVLGACEEKPDVYAAIPINEIIEDYQLISMGFVIYPYQVRHIFPTERKSTLTANLLTNFVQGFSPDAWPVDIQTLPVGTIIINNLTIDYVKSHIVKPL